MPGIPEAVWFRSHCQGDGLRGELPVVVCLSFGNRNVADGFEQSMIVELGHPFERGELDCLLSLPGGTAMNQLGPGSALIVSARALSFVAETENAR